MRSSVSCTRRSIALREIAVALEGRQAACRPPRGERGKRLRVSAARAGIQVHTSVSGRREDGRPVRAHVDVADAGRLADVPPRQRSRYSAMTSSSDTSHARVVPSVSPVTSTCPAGPKLTALTRPPPRTSATTAFEPQFQTSATPLAPATATSRPSGLRSTSSIRPLVRWRARRRPGLRDPRSDPRRPVGCRGDRLDVPPDLLAVPGQGRHELRDEV
jgi:hypothetical protein